MRAYGEKYKSRSASGNRNRVSVQSSEYRERLSFGLPCLHAPTPPVIAMQLLTETDRKILDELKNLRSTLDATIRKSKPQDMRRNLRAVKVTVEGRLRALAQRDPELADFVAPSHHPGNDDLLAESRRLRDSMDRHFAEKEAG